jgi:hypothetical protein
MEPCLNTTITPFLEILIQGFLAGFCEGNRTLVTMQECNFGEGRFSTDDEIVKTKGD